MKNFQNFPCHDWAEKLAVSSSKTLSSADQEALDAHLASCSACKAISEDYRALDECLHEALDVRLPLYVSSELLHLGSGERLEEDKKMIKKRKSNWISPPQLAFQFRSGHSFSSIHTMSNMTMMFLVIGIILSSIALLVYSTLIGTLSPSHVTLTTKPTDGLHISSVYGVQGLPILYNPLTSQQVSGWRLSSDLNSQIECDMNDGFVVILTTNNYCPANHTSSLTNFVYQIEMTTLQEQPGQTAGIVFRVNDVLHHYYSFQVGSVDGSYRLLRSDPMQKGQDTVLANGYSSAIHRRVNILAVKAIGSTLSLYINDQLIQQIRDSSYQEGNIGVGIEINKNALERTAFIFQNAKVWIIEV